MTWTDADRIPPRMTGSASGISTVRRIWRSRKPIPRAASTMSASTPATPAYALTRIGGDRQDDHREQRRVDAEAELRVERRGERAGRCPMTASDGTARPSSRAFTATVAPRRVWPIHRPTGSASAIAMTIESVEIATCSTSRVGIPFGAGPVGRIGEPGDRLADDVQPADSGTPMPRAGAPCSRGPRRRGARRSARRRSEVGRRAPAGSRHRADVDLGREEARPAFEDEEAQAAACVPTVAVIVTSPIVETLASRSAGDRSAEPPAAARPARAAETRVAHARRRPRGRPAARRRSRRRCCGRG